MSCYITIFSLLYIFSIFINNTAGLFNHRQWTAMEMIKHEGYHGEEHNVTTKDGYILTLHRIPAGKPDSTAILLLHGLECNSVSWIFQGKGRALAYLLADEGYDVWLGNVRGNTYGLNHVNLTTDDDAFWDFSFNEMGIYDLPAMLEYITNLNNKSIIYIGHSQGTMITYIMSDQCPLMKKNIQLMIHLAPAAFLKNIGGLLRILGNFPSLFDLYHYFNIPYFLEQYWILKLILKFGCKLFKQQGYICEIFIFAIDGYDSHLNINLLPAILSNIPAGTSLKNMRHYYQGIRIDKFRHFDYGMTKNLEIYNQTIAPDYDLSTADIPTVIINSEADILSNFKDVAKLVKLLPNIIELHTISIGDEFSHLDFLWADNARELVYDRVIKIINDKKLH